MTKNKIYFYDIFDSHNDTHVSQNVTHSPLKYYIKLFFDAYEFYCGIDKSRLFCTQKRGVT